MDWKNYEKYDGKNITVNNEYTGKCELETEGLKLVEIVGYEVDEARSV